MRKQFILKFTFENDAFHSGVHDHATAWILENIAQSIKDGHVDGMVPNFDGKNIGEWAITEEEQ